VACASSTTTGATKTESMPGMKYGVTSRCQRQKVPLIWSLGGELNS
jgi:hypothetical protein